MTQARGNLRAKEAEYQGEAKRLLAFPHSEFLIT